MKHKAAAKSRILSMSLEHGDLGVDLLTAVYEKKCVCDSSMALPRCTLPTNMTASSTPECQNDDLL